MNAPRNTLRTSYVAPSLTAHDERELATVLGWLEVLAGEYGTTRRSKLLARAAEVVARHNETAAALAPYRKPRP